MLRPGIVTTTCAMNATSAPSTRRWSLAAFSGALCYGRCAKLRVRRSSFGYFLPKYAQDFPPYDQLANAFAPSRASFISAISVRLFCSTGCDLFPCIQAPLAEPVGAPPPAPCIRHTFQPRRAGALQRLPVVLALAWHLGALWALCMGLASLSIAEMVSLHPQNPQIELQFLQHAFSRFSLRDNSVERKKVPPINNAPAVFPPLTPAFLDISLTKTRPFVWNCGHTICTQGVFGAALH